MNKLKEVIKLALNDLINENKVYDEILSLDRWYKEEKKKLDDIKNLKTWQLKSSLLSKKFRTLRDELTKKEKDPYALKGDNETKYIYHYTTSDSLIEIIENNEMIGDGDGNEYVGISFTSHPNLYKRGFVFSHPNKYSQGRHHGNIGIKIKFDFNEMKKDGLKFKKGSEKMGTYSGEEELRLMQDQLENPIKYIKEIILFKDKEKEFSKLSEKITNLLKNKNIKYKII